MMVSCQRHGSRDRGCDAVESIWGCNLFKACLYKGLNEQKSELNEKNCKSCGCV